jgi:hypothetical protein
MGTSIFTDKANIPGTDMLSEALGNLHEVWMDVRDYVFQEYPQAIETWDFSGQKNGWSFRIKDKKRVIIYLLPRDKFFLVAFVFGEKATADALGSDIAKSLKAEIESAKVYAEGRGFRIEVRNAEIFEDIKKLINFKIRH